MKDNKHTLLSLRNSINRSRVGRALTVIVFTLGCMAYSPMTRAVSPPPGGGYGHDNTALGTNALFSLTDGHDDTALGFQALLHNTSGNFNTATGVSALVFNTSGLYNTATGFEALYSNVTGNGNTANGFAALVFNLGSDNAATGFSALYHNTTGSNNTANGANALLSNTSGTQNTAVGVSALYHNSNGVNNTAEGYLALINNTSGRGNIGLGVLAGSELTTGNNNIDIGNSGVMGESSSIRLGTRGTHTNTFIAGISGVAVPGGVGVIVDTNGHLGTVVSSERFKDEIKPMDKASEVLLELKPVTFRYKHELDPKGTPQFGLVAEQVEKVNPDLVARDEKGKVYTVRYEAVNAMLLNEFLKQHRKVEEQQATMTQLKATVAKQEATITQQQKDFQSALEQQQKDTKVLAMRLNEQALQIQRVSQQLPVSQTAPQLVVNNQ